MVKHGLPPIYAKSYSLFRLSVVTVSSAIAAKSYVILLFISIPYTAKLSFFLFRYHTLTYLVWLL